MSHTVIGKGLNWKFAYLNSSKVLPRKIINNWKTKKVYFLEEVNLIYKMTPVMRQIKFVWHLVDAMTAHCPSYNIPPNNCDWNTRKHIQSQIKGHPTK